MLIACILDVCNKLCIYEIYLMPFLTKIIIIAVIDLSDYDWYIPIVLPLELENVEENVSINLYQFYVQFYVHIYL